MFRIQIAGENIPIMTLQEALNS